MQQTDILIIDGGIAGTATTCYLAQYGRQVILLEQSELAAKASGLNAGTLWATGWGRTPDLSFTLSMGSLEIFKTLQLDLGYDLRARCRTFPSPVPGRGGCPLHEICTPSSARSPTSTNSTCSRV
jgi:glycine/D-amino acid oxidase-like deaminating enzyme